MDGNRESKDERNREGFGVLWKYNPELNESIKDNLYDYMRLLQWGGRSIIINFHSLVYSTLFLEETAVWTRIRA